MSIYLCFISLCGIIRINEPVSWESIKNSPNNTKVFYGGLVIMFNFYIWAKVNREFIKEVINKLISKEEYKFILDHLEHSIILVENDQVEFVNSKFLNQFKD